MKCPENGLSICGREQSGYCVKGVMQIGAHVSRLFSRQTRYLEKPSLQQTQTRYMAGSLKKTHSHISLSGLISLSYPLPWSSTLYHIQSQVI